MTELNEKQISQNNENLYVNTSYKLSSALREEQKTNLYCIGFIFFLIFLQFYYFIGYTPINPDAALEFIQVPGFHPLLGMGLYFASTLFALLAYPKTKNSIVKKFSIQTRSQYTASSTTDELEKFKSETNDVLHSRHNVKKIQYAVLFVVACFTLGLTILSYNLHHYVEIHNKLGAEVNSLSTTNEQIDLINQKVANGEIDKHLQGYYINQILYINFEKKLNSSNIYALESDAPISAAKYILEGAKPTPNFDTNLYLSNLETWTEKNESGRYRKSMQGKFNGIFLHNHEPLIVLGNYLKNHQVK